MIKVRTRIPPSPTGMFHVGSLRTALYNYLYAKKHGGEFILRIEDTDQERFVPGSMENIIETLAIAGIAPDEGPYMTAEGSIEEKGEYGPYVQSARLPIYKQYVDQLIAQGHAYYAFDSADALEAMREQQRLNKQATRYDRASMKNSFTLSKEEVEERLAKGEEYVVRMKVPSEGSTSFHDVVRGTITFDNKEVDDQILLKSDGFPTYHLAVVVDDHLMQITHVSRGEEWLPSTPKHVLLYQMFGWDMPVFAHQPLLVNEQKQKLSKRHGDVSVKDFLEKGYLIEALLNFVAFLGWNPKTEQEIFSLEELIVAFDLDQISKSAAVFNREKLDWYNKQYLMKSSAQEVARRAKPFFDQAGFTLSEQDIARVIPLEQERVTTLAEFPAALSFIFQDTLSYAPELLVWKKDTRERSREILQLLVTQMDTMLAWTKEDIENSIKNWIQQEQLGVGNVLWPMRTALSGQQNSPGPFEIAAVLGKEKTIQRLQQAIDVLA